MSLSLKTRLNCARSYATEETSDLLCDAGNGTTKCNGTLRPECLCDISVTEQMARTWEDENES